jgi:hypothetical protein
MASCHRPVSANDGVGLYIFGIGQCGLSSSGHLLKADQLRLTQVDQSYPSSVAFVVQNLNVGHAREGVSSLPREHCLLGWLAQHQYRKAQLIRQVGVAREASLHNLKGSLHL